MLTEERKEYFKMLLTQQLEALLKDVNIPLTNFKAFKDDFSDLLDLACKETDMNYMFCIREREGRFVYKIAEALERLEHNIYGICEECGEEISEERLEARPVTTLCIECKKIEEAKERIRGG